MMRSLSSAVGGLRSHQTRMDTIGNNIANVNTYGFKSSRVTFSDVYYQSTSTGSAPTTQLGGTNPTQIGYGAAVATIDVLNSPSGMASTDRALDVYINGDGMITTQDANGNLSTPVWACSALTPRATWWTPTVTSSWASPWTPLPACPLSGPTAPVI